MIQDVLTAIGTGFAAGITLRLPWYAYQMVSKATRLAADGE